MLGYFDWRRGKVWIFLLSLLALARANEIDFGVAGKPSWYSCNFVDSIEYDFRSFEDTSVLI